METDQERLDGLTRRAADYAVEKADKLNQQVSELKKKIEDLLHERSEIQGLPMTPQETLAIAKSTLIERRKSIFMEELLIPHLRDIQNKHCGFLEPTSLRVHFLDELKLFRWVYGSWITEADLIQAMAALPSDVGIDEKERARRIAIIDEKIKKLEGEIVKLLS
jgi:hypothetical protein